MRSTIITLTALALLVLGLPAAFFAAGGDASATPGGAIGGSCTVRSPTSGPDVTLDANQMTHARTVADVVRTRELPERALAITLTSALAASDLSAAQATLTGPTGRGLFALDPAGHPGIDLQDPAAATAAYLDRLSAVPDYLLLPTASAADRVQAPPSGRPHREWAPVASALAAGLTGRDTSLVRCTGGDAGGGPGAPAGTATARALAAARAQLGVWYVWAGGDADGPTTGTQVPCTASPSNHGCGFDCSGLVLHAWARAGIALPRTSRQQYHAGQRIPLAAARPGDLIFLATDITNPGTIHHVAMVNSPGTIIEAQQTGTPVHVRPYRGADEPEIMPFAVRVAP